MYTQTSIHGGLNSSAANSSIPTSKNLREKKCASSNCSIINSDKQKHSEEFKTLCISKI